MATSKAATNWLRKSRRSPRFRVQSGIDVLRRVGRQANKFLVSCEAVRAEAVGPAKVKRIATRKPVHDYSNMQIKQMRGPSLLLLVC